uniref:Uncharacterized protein n=1 Tax=Proboscia inermis TaxID=420281 RepID=A0A7S0GIT8_9STRA|mmetsp:Transcript_6759/g.6910  ORF Transcript_6759/g.6910 Transcript_6759/m.6910 type:complete len:116 (+) Transcript_6759:2-349(+)
MRYTSNDPFENLSRVDGHCKNEQLGVGGVAIKTNSSALFVHAKGSDKKIRECSTNDNNIRTFRLRCTCPSVASMCYGFNQFPGVQRIKFAPPTPPSTFTPPDGELLELNFELAMD